MASIHTCIVCHRTFWETKTQLVRKFCSRNCCGLGKKIPVRYCQDCGVVLRQYKKETRCRSCSTASRKLLTLERHKQKCQTCGVFFFAKPCAKRKFCSSSCIRFKPTGPKVPRLEFSCRNCGKKLFKLPGQMKMSGGRKWQGFCSDCRTCSLRHEHSRKKKQKFRVRKVTKSTRAHLLVSQNILGRKVSKHERILFVDGNKLNCDPSNILITERPLQTCNFCGKAFWRPAWGNGKWKTMYCNRRCRAQGSDNLKQLAKMREKIKLRPFTCVVCGKEGRSRNATPNRKKTCTRFCSYQCRLVSLRKGFKNERMGKELGQGCPPDEQRSGNPIPAGCSTIKGLRRS